MDRNRPADITALSLFFGFGAILCAAAALMVHSTGELPKIWRATAVSTLGTEAVSWLVMVCIACVVASLGLWRVSYWGFLTGTILLIIFIILLIGALPRWGHSANWGYGPSGIVGLILVVIVILLLLGRI